MDAKVREQIRTLVRTGFHQDEDMVEIVCSELHEPGTLDEDEVAAAIDAEIRALATEQASWPGETDCDRLDAVFAALNQRGVIALQNAGNTQSDGYEDVREAYKRASNRSELIGYCFYHGQDLERAVLGEGLWLAFGPMNPHREASEGPKVGALVVQELERRGFRVRWNGTFQQRIFVENLEWKKRI